MLATAPLERPDPALAAAAAARDKVLSDPAPLPGAAEGQQGLRAGSNPLSAGFDSGRDGDRNEA